MSSFSLKSASAEFSQRQRNIFDQLKVLENNRKNTSSSSNHDTRMETEDPDPEEGERNPRRTQRSITRTFRGKESIFKKPQNPAPKNFFNRIPDFKKNPHKWTKYSLEDVSDEDMSDKGNTKAALAFLQQLETRKSLENEKMDDGDSEKLPKRIIFKKHVGEGKKDQRDPEASKSTFRSSKVVMPEYVVGGKVKKEKRSKGVKNNGKGAELKLDHLFEHENDEDDN